MKYIANVLVMGMLALAWISCRQDPEILFTSLGPSATGITFANTIEEDDTFNIVDYYYVYNGGGVATGDINNDGLPDIFFTGNRTGDRLYLNKGDLTFEDITTTAGIIKSGWSTGVTMADVNGDRLLDIYVCKSGNYPPAKRANKLYINRGDLTFDEQAAAYGLADTTHTNQAAFFDYDKDGDLDAYLMTSTNAIRNPNKFVRPRDDGSGLSVDKLLQNNNNAFVDVSHSAGITHDGFGLGLAICDLNGDGWEDVLVSNDFLANDHLYINRHDGTFEESAKRYFKHHSHFSMGNDVGDFNNDGRPDVVVVDMLPEDPVQRKKMAGPVNPNAFEAMVRAGYHPQYMRNMLFVNLGFNHEQQPVFTETAQQHGIHSTDWSWAPLWVDVDHDGWQDLFITNGYLRDITDMDFVVHNNVTASSGNIERTNRAMREGAKRMPSIKKNNVLYQNLGDGGFSDVSSEWLPDLPSLSNGAAVADLDLDGDVDIIVNNVNEPAFVLRNNARGTRYLKVSLSGPAKNTKGLGSEVTVYVGGMVQSRHMAVTRGYQSSVDYVLNFGLDDHPAADSITVAWPDGKVEVRYDVPANKDVTFDYRAARHRTNVFDDKPPSIVENITGKFGLDHRHREEFYMDYDAEPLLPHKLSQQGPCLAVGDINGDGMDDFFVGGSYRHQGTLFVQDKQGVFHQRPVVKQEDKSEEDTDAAFFDADDDGDLDLYIVSGSNEFHDGSPYYQDRLLINDGNGHFRLSRGMLPEIRHSGSCVVANDFDNDGDTDVFRGGRLTPLEFPKPGTSYLLVNQGGKFVDVTDSLARGLRNIGMVTGAAWADIDNNGWADLVLAGEYMPLVTFRNDHGRLSHFDDPVLRETYGLWYSVTAADIDGDGDTDILAGNLGLNSRYRFSKDKPLSVYGGDFDDNGRWDAIPAYHSGSAEYPAPSLFDLVRQVPVFKQRYQTFETYARATMDDILLPVKERIRYVARAYEQKSIIVENTGAGFNIRPFPEAVQRSPVTAVLAHDVNDDGHIDLITTGNDYAAEPVAGQYDAGVGVILVRNGEGAFETVPPERSGFWTEGDTRKIGVVNSANGRIILVTRNNGQLLAFRLKQTGGKDADLYANNLP